MMNKSFVMDQYLDTVVDEIYPLLKREFGRVSVQSVVNIAEEIIRKRMLPIRVAPGDVVYAYSEKHKKVLGYQIEQVTADYSEAKDGSTKVFTRAYAYSYVNATGNMTNMIDSIDFNVCELGDRVFLTLEEARQHNIELEATI